MKNVYDEFLLLFDGALGIPRPKAFMWFGAVVKPGGGNRVLAGAEGPTGVTLVGPSPKPSNNFAHPDTLGGNLKIETRNCGRISFYMAPRKVICNWGKEIKQLLGEWTGDVGGNSMQNHITTGSRFICKDVKEQH